MKFDRRGTEPFNLDALPVWFYPNLFEEEKEVAYRGWWFVLLYLVSILLNTLFIFGPIAVYMMIGSGLQGLTVTLAIWLAFGIPSGVLVGLAGWREFNLQKRRLQEERRLEKQ